jgi:hypothetical protein
MKSSSLGRLRVILVLGGLASTSGCSEPPCDSALSPNATYSVHLIDDYTSASRFRYSVVNGDSYPGAGRCQAIDGFQVGAAFTLHGNGEESARNNICEYVTADLEGAPTGVTVVGPGTDALALNRTAGTEGLYAVADVKTSDCAASILLKLYGGGAAGGMFSTPVDGDYPPAVIYRLFVPSSGSCQVCDDNFAASVAKD